jgi:uncharacterized protein YecE (DUF72 family)
MTRVHVGLSGYSYKEWQGEGRFYPPALKQREYLTYYASRYNALEADGTWYQMPSEKSVAKWIDETPDDFRVSPKMHREVTHFARLKPQGVEALNTFLETLQPLEKAGKLGPILLQLPPNLKRDDDLLDSFLSSIPHCATLKWCLEFRNATWHTPEVEALLLKKNVAWVAADTDEDDAQLRDTAAHVYVRLRKSDYSPDALKLWADYLRTKTAEGKDCYLYCKHKDAFAPWDWADGLLKHLSA